MLGWLMTGIDPVTGEKETAFSPCWAALWSYRYAFALLASQLAGYTFALLRSW